jgi:hypothetical protein
VNESFDLKKKDQTGATKFDPCADTFIRIGLSLLSLIPAIALVTTTINYSTRLIKTIKTIQTDISANKSMYSVHTTLVHVLQLV